jgi:hypothetical protein
VEIERSDREMRGRSEKPSMQERTANEEKKQQITDYRERESSRERVQEREREREGGGGGGGEKEKRRKGVIAYQ